MARFRDEEMRQFNGAGWLDEANRIVHIPIRLFAAAALLWLTILLGLGSLDPMTRIEYRVQAGYPK
jgi:hypothetical protein